MQKHGKFVAAWLVILASLIWHPAVASDTRCSPVIAPSGRLYMTGSFDIGRVPKLSAVCLFNADEPEPSVGWFPEPVSAASSPFRKSGGQIVVRAKNGKSVSGTWDRVGLFEQVIPGGGRLLRWGWVAVVPYLADANEYELLENSVSIGGQSFGTPKPWEPVECSVTCSMVTSPFEDEPTDLVTSYTKPVKETLFHISQPIFQASHGHWGFWRLAGESNWKPLRLASYPIEDSLRLISEWEDSKWMDKHRGAMRDTSNDWLIALPGTKNRPPVKVQDQKRPFTLRTFLLKSDISYPLSVEVLYRRAHGLTVVEDRLVFQLKEPPPIRVTPKQ